MNYFLLRNLSDQINKEDLENACAKFGKVEYVKIQPSSSSGRVAVVKMAMVDRHTPQIKERHGHEYKGRRLRLVKPGPPATKTGELKQSVSKGKSMHPITRAAENLLRSLRMLKSLPQKVRVRR